MDFKDFCCYFLIFNLYINEYLNNETIFYTIYIEEFGPEVPNIKIESIVDVKLYMNSCHFIEHRYAILLFRHTK